MNDSAIEDTNMTDLTHAKAFSGNSTCERRRHHDLRNRIELSCTYTLQGPYMAAFDAAPHMNLLEGPYGLNLGSILNSTP